MGTTLFDTAVVPHWRTAGAVTVFAPTRVELGDPCHGLVDAGSPLPPGEWVWEIRDADADGQPRHRVWEVRLRAADTAVADDWDWVDEYGNYRDTPTPGAHLSGFRGVDAGQIAWRLVARDADGTRDRGYAYDEDLLELNLRDAATDDGRLLMTSTGWGDGAYPVAVRTVDGAVVEVRTCYVTPDPTPLTPAEFTALLPGAFTSAGNQTGSTGAVTGPVTLTVSRTRYTSDNGEEVAERGYEQLLDVSVLLDGLPTTFVRSYPSFEDDADPEDRGVFYAPDLVAGLETLWLRVAEEDRGALVAREVADAWEDQPHHARGFIKEYATCRAQLTLADPA